MFHITLDDERGIVELRLAADMTFEEHVAARKAVLAECTRRGIRRILVDAAELSPKPRTVELFAFASEWPALLRRAPVVVAGVLPRNEEARHSWRFGEDVAVNRGLISHSFETVEDARAWLARW